MYETIDGTAKDWSWKILGGKAFHYSLPTAAVLDGLAGLTECEYNISRMYLGLRMYEAIDGTA